MTRLQTGFFLRMTSQIIFFSGCDQSDSLDILFLSDKDATDQKYFSSVTEDVASQTDWTIGCALVTMDAVSQID
jgi:hypothetical protein